MKDFKGNMFFWCLATLASLGACGPTAQSIDKSAFGKGSSKTGSNLQANLSSGNTLQKQEEVTYETYELHGQFFEEGDEALEAFDSKMSAEGYQTRKLEKELRKAFAKTHRAALVPGNSDQNMPRFTECVVVLKGISKRKIAALNASKDLKISFKRPLQAGKSGELILDGIPASLSSEIAESQITEVTLYFP